MGHPDFRAFGRIFAIACTRPPSDFALLAETMASEKPREWRIGTLESDSAPPAIATFTCPSAIWSAASVIAWLAEAQARLTVNACVDFGRCGISETSRAMFGAMTDGMTVPKTSASTCAPSSSERWMSSATTRRPRSIAETERSVVPARANGVRSPATMATRWVLFSFMGESYRKGSSGAAWLTSRPR